MAGIGFVLQKVLKEGGIFSFVKVALAGMIIVAGPWLLSIIGIFIITRFANSAIAESPTLFMAVIIHNYAFSLIIFGGFHYIFTRQIADLIYVDLKSEAGSALIGFSILIAASSAIIALMVYFQIDFSIIAHSFLFRIAAILLFVIINIIWLLMIFISLLKKFITIFIIYALGMAGSYIGVIVLGQFFAAGGAMAGFASGQLFIVVSLYSMAFLEFRPSKLNFKLFFKYLIKFRYLLLSGIFYYWGMWIDKLVFWFMKGKQVENTFFKIFDQYDIPVYLSNLTIIPGLIFFMVISETSFYNCLTDLLNSLHNAIYKHIQAKKYLLIISMKKGLMEQSIFQGVFTFVLIFLAGDISKLFFVGTLDIGVFRFTLSAVFFHLLFLALTIYLYYLQLFKKAFYAALCFFLVNFAGSIIIVFSGKNGFYGSSYLLAGILASILSYIYIMPSLKRYDRILYMQASKGE